MYKTTSHKPSKCIVTRYNSSGNVISKEPYEKPVESDLELYMFDGQLLTYSEVKQKCAEYGMSIRDAEYLFHE